MDKYKKKFASAFDGLRNHHTKVDIEITEKITSNNIGLTKIIRHGFPDKARCLAYDPVQKLIAIGSGNGSLRLLGDAGVDYHLCHPSGTEVTHIKFLINEGGLITVTKDDMIHLWNYRQKQADIVHSLQMRQEKITCIELPVSSKWLYIGTERGNVYVLCVANFKLSSYVINWNKAIDLSCRTHPGPVKHLSISPLDPTKLLIGFDNGYVVLWNLLNKEVERYKNNGQIRNISWHHDGKQFMCGCNDGSLVIWSVKKSSEPYQVIYPREQKCRPITHLFWFQGSSNDMVIFAGGMGLDDGATPAITVMKPKGSLAVLELDHAIVDICPILNSPYTNFPQLPHALAILMKEELVILDLSISGFPIFENPHPTDISESPVVYMKYYSDCPVDMIGALTLLGCKQRTANPRISTKTWPITGGEEREVATSNQELLLTGHEDGSIKFWQSSGDHLQLMYKLKTGRHFEKTEPTVPTSQSPEYIKNPHSITFIAMCLESRLLAVAGNAGQVTLFRLNKNESANDIAVINILGSYSVDSPFNQSTSNVGDCGGLKNQNSVISSRTSSMTSEGSQTSEQHFLKVRGGAIRRAAGFQPELVCLITSTAHSLINNKKLVGSISLNSSYGLMAIGTVNDLCLIDIVQCTLVFCLSISELYSFENTSNTQLCLNVDSPQDERYALVLTKFMKPLSMSQYCSELTNNFGSNDLTSGEIVSNKKDIVNDKGQYLSEQTPSIVNILRRRTSEMAHSAKKKIEKKFSQHHPAINNKYNNDKIPPNRPDILSTSFNSNVKNDSLRSVPFLSVDLVDTPSPCSLPSPASSHTSYSMSNVSFSLQSSQENPDNRPKSENNMRGKLSRSHKLPSFENAELVKQFSDEHEHLSASSSNLKAQSPFGTASNIVRRLTGKNFFGKSKPVISKNEKSEDITPNSSYHDLTDNLLYNNIHCVVFPLITFASLQQVDSSPINKEKSGIKFMRLNTDLRQKSYDKRPILARAQSMAAGAVASLTGNNPDLNFGENGNNKDSSYSNLTTQDSPSISSSLEKLSLYETITFVEFISTVATKNSTKVIPTLYIGTSSGVCLAYSLNIPTERITSNVTISNVLCAQKLKGEMLYCCFMDDTFRLLTGPSESYKESNSDSPKTTQNKIVTKNPLLPTISNSNDSNTVMDEINQITVIVSECEARVIALPNCLTIFSYKSDRSFVKVEASHINGYPILIILNEAGEIVVLSLPSLKFLYKSQLFSKSVDLDDPMVTKIAFSDYGLGAYMVTPSEIQKFTISRELAAQISECSGEVFIPKDMPEQPKPSLLQGVSTLFGGGVTKDINSLEAIFNDKDKNGQGLVTMKSIARTIQSPAMTNMEHAQGRGISAGQAAQMALQNLNERTDKLNAVVDTTENLKNNAQSLATRSGKLVEKYEKKKWYNF